MNPSVNSVYGLAAQLSQPSVMCAMLAGAFYPDMIHIAYDILHSEPPSVRDDLYMLNAYSDYLGIPRPDSSIENLSYGTKEYIERYNTEFCRISMHILRKVVNDANSELISNSNKG